MGESPSRDELDRPSPGSPDESDTEGEDPGLGGLYREPEASPGPSPVPPMETPYLQREARPGAEPGPRPGAEPGPRPGAWPGPGPGAWPGAGNTIPLGRGLARGIGRVLPPGARPGSDRVPDNRGRGALQPEPQWSQPPRPGPTGTNRDPDNRGQEAPQPEPPWVQPPRPGPCPDTYTPGPGWHTYRPPYPGPYGPGAFWPDQPPFGPQWQGPFRPDPYASGIYAPVPRYNLESTRAYYSVPQENQLQETQVKSSIPMPGTSVPMFIPVVSNPTSIPLSAPSAMSTTISRDLMRDLNASDLTDIQEGLELLRRQRAANASISAPITTPSVVTPIDSSGLGAVTLLAPVAATGGPRGMKTLNDKLLPYDGQSEPFESFRTRYEGCSRHYQWDPAERLYFLRQALDRKVNNVVWDSGNVATAEQLLELLAARYGTEAQAAGFRSELKWRTKKGTETQHDLYYDVRRLASLAWPGQQGTQVTEDNAIDAFADAQEDDRIRTEISMRGAKTLVEALNMAVKYENLHKDKRPKAAPAVSPTRDPYDAEGRKRDKGLVRAVEATKFPDPASAERDRLLKECQTELAELKTWKTQTEERRQWFKDHPRGQRGKSRGAPNTPQSGPRTCFTCGVEGHFKQDCPNKVASGPAGGKAPQPGAARAAGWAIKAAESYIEVEYKGKAMQCLIDTGCDHSLGPWKMVPGETVYPAHVEIQAASGHQILVLGRVKMKFTVSGKEFEADVLVSDAVDELMLGFDWLTAHKAHVFLDDRMLSLSGFRIPFVARRGKVACRRVFAREPVTIPPNTECNVPVQLVRPNMRTPESDWVVNPITLKSQVFLARVLLPDSDTHAAVRIINLSKEEYTVKGGQDIGKADAAQVLENIFPDGHTTQLPRCGTSPPRRPARGNGRNKYRAHAVQVEEDLSYLQPVIDSLPDTLSEEDRATAIKLIHQYKDVFSKHEYDLGRTDLLEHKIDTGDARPYRQALRRSPQVHQEVIDREVNKMLDSGVIEPACSPWAS